MKIKKIQEHKMNI